MHRMLSLARLFAAYGLIACDSGALATTAPDGGTGGAPHGADRCQPGTDLAGTAYDVTKSRFAFGSTPVRQDEYGTIRWVGVDGVLAIEPCGSARGSMNGGAPESSLPDWSGDPAALSGHVREYFISMGVDACQIANTLTFAGGTVTCSIDPDAGPCETANQHRTVSLARGVDGVPVIESQAYARFNVNDQSTSEGFYWPTIPAGTVLAARALRDQLADLSARLAYQAKLPANAQGSGQVVLHHSSCPSSSSDFRSAAAYDVRQSSSTGMEPMLSFDADGNAVTEAW